MIHHFGESTFWILWETTSKGIASQDPAKSGEAFVKEVGVQFSKIKSKMSTDMSEIGDVLMKVSVVMTTSKPDAEKINDALAILQGANISEETLKTASEEAQAEIHEEIKKNEANKKKTEIETGV
jgi:hypothetical protein